MPLNAGDGETENEYTLRCSVFTCSWSHIEFDVRWLGWADAAA